MRGRAHAEGRSPIAQGSLADGLFFARQQGPQAPTVERITRSAERRIAEVDQCGKQIQRFDHGVALESAR